LNQAVKDGMIEKNPANDIRGIKGEEVRKDTLTLDEITKLTNTSIDDEVLKQAFLFMCFTGLRFIDVKTLNMVILKMEINILFH